MIDDDDPGNNGDMGQGRNMVKGAGLSSSSFLLVIQKTVTVREKGSIWFMRLFLTDR